MAELLRKCEIPLQQISRAVLINADNALANPVDGTVSEAVLGHIATRLANGETVIVYSKYGKDRLLSMVGTLADSPGSENFLIVPKSGNRANARKAIDVLRSTGINPNHVTIVSANSQDLDNARRLKAEGKDVTMVYVGFQEEFDETGLENEIKIPNNGIFHSGAEEYFEKLDRKEPFPYQPGPLDSAKPGAGEIPVRVPFKLA